MDEPLLFVCVREPTSSKDQVDAARIVSIKSPAGPVFMAFGSHELAGTLIAMFGVGEGVFLVPETHLFPELVGSVTHHRVVIIDTLDDYNGATGNESDFPWPDRTVLYDFAAALARASPQ